MIVRHQISTFLGAPSTDIEFTGTSADGVARHAIERLWIAGGKTRIIQVNTVATHATNAPFHGSTTEAWLLHYADLFAADHAFRVMGEVPLYLRKH